MKYCTLTGVIRHGDTGYGFKLSVPDSHEANMLKKNIKAVLVMKGYIVNEKEWLF